MAKTVNVPEHLLPLFDRAEELVKAYFQRKREAPEQGHIRIDQERYILVRAASLSVEFYEMMKDLYRGREAEAFSVAKNLLFHIAHFIGRSDAQAFHQKLGLEDPVAKLSAGPVHFAHTGWAFVDIFPESRMAPDESYFLVYDHPYSFESDSWRKAGQTAPFPVCFMNAGYSSGWCEESFGVPLVSIEILCTGKGDPCCRFIMAHPSRIEGFVREYLDAHPDVASQVTGYEVPGEFVRKELEERLKVSEHRYRLLFENAFDAIVLIEGERIDHINRRATELYGLTRDEMRGRPWAELAPDVQPDGKPSLEVFQHRSRRALSGKAQVFHWQCLGPKGATVDTEVSLNMIEGASGRLLAIMRDISSRTRAQKERKRLEAEVRHLQKMEALGTLAGGVAHDFNNILTGLLGSVVLAEEELSPKSEAFRSLEDARALIDRASGLVKHLLTFARSSQEVAEIVGPNRIVRNTLKLLRETIDRRIRLVSNLAEDVGMVEGDPNHLSQVIVNLALNARDSILDKIDAHGFEAFPSEGPTLLLETARVIRDPEGPSHRGEDRELETVRLRVTDNGMGMDPEIQDRAFEPFFTTKAQGKGTGLGLTMVFGIVQRHQGWVEIDSEPGKGTTVSIYLPSAQEDASPKPSAQEDVEHLSGDETVLFVDDEEAIRKIAAYRLQAKGYRVLTASNGADGVRIVAERGDSVDIVVLDNTMPELSGTEALEKILEIRPELPVIMASGYFTKEDPKELMHKGAADILPKPYAPEDLMRCIRSVLDRRRGGH
ncbi:MAG: response regulator [Planctomycetota bacterium]|jgi:PAS domain S-box-containing protein